MSNIKSPSPLSNQVPSDLAPPPDIGILIYSSLFKGGRGVFIATSICLSRLSLERLLQSPGQFHRGRRRHGIVHPGHRPALDHD